MDVKITVNSNRTRTYTVSGVASTEEALSTVLSDVADADPVVTGGDVVASEENQADARNFSTQVIPA